MKEFTTVLAVEPVKIEGELYEVCEMTTGGRKRYMIAVGSAMKVRMISTGKVDPKGSDIMRKEIDILNLDGAQVELLEATMVKVDDDGKKTPVRRPVIESWKVSLTEDLVKVASGLNRLGFSEEKLQAEAVKN